MVCCGFRAPLRMKIEGNSRRPLNIKPPACRHTGLGYFFKL
jgi:hypothetical protein